MNFLKQIFCTLLGKLPGAYSREKASSKFVSTSVLKQRKNIVSNSTFCNFDFAMTIQSEKSSERSQGSPGTTSTGETKS